MVMLPVLVVVAGLKALRVARTLIVDVLRRVDMKVNGILDAHPLRSVGAARNR
jgi:hypothetical protein